MKRIILLVWLFPAIITTLLAQTQAITFQPAIPHCIGSLFNLRENGNVLEGAFIGDRNSRRPLILFVQGSGPVPLFGSVGDTVFHPLFPWQLLQDTTQFNFILLSKPGIPAVCSLGRLDERYYYHAEGKAGPAPETYLSHNTLGFYHSAYAALLDHMNEICNCTDITVMGHSQGARIAAELANHPAVDRLVYMSADPLGRMATLYDGEYAKFKQRDPERLSFYQGLMDPAHADSVFMGERYASFRSFAKPSILSLAKAKVPVLVIYGDLDESCPNCYVLSLLPQWCPEIHVLHYSGYDHNYFDLQGTNHWGDVVKDVYDWILSP